MLSLYEYETAVDAPVDTGAPAEAPAEPAAVETEPAGEATPDEPLAGGFDETAFMERALEEARAVAQAQVAQYLPQAAPQNVPGATPGPMSGQLPDFDIFDPESFAAYLDARDQRQLQQIQQVIGPVAQTFEQAQEAANLEQGDQIAKDILADEIARSGEFLLPDSNDMVMEKAERYIGDMIARYDNGTQQGRIRAVEASIAQGYKDVAAYEKKVVEAGVARYTNHVATLAGANSEPGVGTSGVGSIAGAEAAQRIASGQPANLAQKYGRTA